MYRETEVEKETESNNIVLCVHIRKAYLQYSQ